MRPQPTPSLLVVRCVLALLALATTACPGAAETPGVSRARIGGGRSLDRLTVGQASFPPFEAFEADASTRPGLHLFTDVRSWRRGPLMLGLGLEQLLGLAHELGPLRIDDPSRVPAARLSPNCTTLTRVLGIGDSFE